MIHYVIMLLDGVLLLFVVGIFLDLAFDDVVFVSDNIVTTLDCHSVSLRVGAGVFLVVAFIKSPI